MHVLLINILLFYQALKKIGESFDFKDAHLELASDSRASDFVAFYKEHFYPDETLCKSIELNFDNEVTSFFLNVLSQNLSVILVSNVTGEIIAGRSMRVARRTDVADWSDLKNEKMAAIMTFLGHKYINGANVFKRFKVDTAVEFVALGTHRNYRGQGLATKVMAATIEFCKELGLNPVCIKGEATSLYSQRIYEKFGFEVLHTVRFQDYKVNGEVVFRDTGDVEEVKCYVKQL